jgi:hypothetical protein
MCHGVEDPGWREVAVRQMRTSIVLVSGAIALSLGLGPAGVSAQTPAPATPAQAAAPAAPARGTSGPSCADVAKAPSKYVGQSVEFVATMTALDLKSANGHQDMLNTWECKDQSGKAIGASFTFWNSVVTWTDAASKASALKDLFLVTGVVAADEGTVPLLKNVTIRLPSQPAK